MISYYHLLINYCTECTRSCTQQIHQHAVCLFLLCVKIEMGWCWCSCNFTSCSPWRFKMVWTVNLGTACRCRFLRPLQDSTFEKCKSFSRPRRWRSDWSARLIILVVCNSLLPVVSLKMFTLRRIYRPPLWQMRTRSIITSFAMHMDKMENTRIPTITVARILSADTCWVVDSSVWQLG